VEKKKERKEKYENRSNEEIEEKQNLTRKKDGQK
jgi:hypothetical protein